jgi:hypothetical protein
VAAATIGIIIGGAMFIRWVSVRGVESDPVNAAGEGASKQCDEYGSFHLHSFPAL